MSRLMERADLEPTILILASQHDFACDYVISRLRSKGETYLRLNSEDLPRLELTLDPRGPTLFGELPPKTGEPAGVHFKVLSENLKSIYFRRPVFLRHAPANIRSPEEQFALEQWATLTRSLMVFERCRWINSPMHTYRAENKPYQLATATRLGFNIPDTIVTNSNKYIAQKFASTASIAIKGIDTVFIQGGQEDLFGYTSILTHDEVARSHIQSIPLIAQRAILNKIDLRVTVVGEQVFCASITIDGSPIGGDWRLQKRNTKFSPFSLPREVSRKCIELTQALGLTYGAIDLALDDGQFYFLEINPTGEWAWLVDAAGFPLDEVIANELAWAR